MYSKDFSKIYNQNIEVTKVLHKNLLVWSSGFDGDFTKVDLWEYGTLYNGAPTSPVVKDTEARTKDFHTIPTVGLNLLSMNTAVSWSFYGINVYFYNSDYGYISKSYTNTLGSITLPSGAKYYKLSFYNGIGAQRYPLDIQVHVPEANIKFLTEPDVYLAKDSDFVKVNGYWVYRGSALEVEIPTHINGELVTSAQNMFNGDSAYAATPVTKVVLKHSNVTNMRFMFYASNATTLDLSSFDTSNVVEMDSMFYYSKATALDLSNFNTSNVTNMSTMFYYSNATALDLSSFNTSNVTNMRAMFRDSSATALDLSNFNTSNVTNMSTMFRDSSATTLDLSSFNTSNVTDMSRMFQDSSATRGYARTQADANKFNSSSYKPTGLNFVVKP